MNKEDKYELMVCRFLGWKLPPNFCPDAGVSFAPAPYQLPEGRHWPSGTNLLTAGQALQMFKHCVEDIQSAAALDVLAERRRQIEKEGYDPTHDDAHVNDEIAALACFYAMPPAAREWCAESTGYGDTLGEAILPDGWVASWSERRRELVKAGALILAEIERLDRKQ